MKHATKYVLSTVTVVQPGHVFSKAIYSYLVNNAQSIPSSIYLSIAASFCFYNPKKGCM